MLRSRPTIVLLLLALLVVAAVPPLAVAKDEPAAGKKEAAQQPGPFTPRVDLMIWTIIVFGLLLAVLKKWAWGPMLDGLKAREARIRGALEEANASREDAQKLREQLKVEMNKIQDRMREMLDEARRGGQDLKERMFAEGKAEIQAEKERSLREIEATREQAKQELWSQTAQLATLVSAKAIGRALTVDDHRHLVDEAVTELTGATAGQHV